MKSDEAFEQLQIAVQNPQQGPRQIAKLASAGFDLNYTPYPQHPIFLAMPAIILISSTPQLITGSDLITATRIITMPP